MCDRWSRSIPLIFLSTNQCFDPYFFLIKRTKLFWDRFLASQLKESKTLGKPKIECVRVQVKDQTKNLYFWPKTCTFCATQTNDIKCMKGCGRQFLYQRWHLECIQPFRADCIWSSLLQWFRFVFSFLWIIYCAACIEVEIKHTHDDLVNVQILINLYFSLSRQTKYRNSVFTYFFCSLLERAMRHSSCFL